MHDTHSRQDVAALNRLFDLVVALPEERREAAIQRHSDGDELTARRVRDMLRWVDGDTDELLQPLSGSGSPYRDPSNDRRQRQDPDMSELDGDPLLAGVPRAAGFPVLWPYAIDRRVGRGGYGAVYHATHLEDGTEVAIKRLRPSARDAGGFDVRCEREARLGRALKSPHLVQVFSCDERGGVTYLVMEWLEGEDLGRRVRRLGARPWREVVPLLRGLAGALAAMHALGVVHRDVKPHNVMLTSAGEVKLADLGLARRFGRPRRKRESGCGSWAFGAPEQRAGSCPVRPTADVYAFGVTALFLLTGRVRADGAEGALSQLVASHGVPRAFVAVIADCLATRPAARPKDGGALERRLSAVSGVVDEGAVSDTQPKRSSSAGAAGSGPLSLPCRKHISATMRRLADTGRRPGASDSDTVAEPEGSEGGGHLSVLLLCAFLAVVVLSYVAHAL